jgi:hypothetical protein
MLRVSALEVGDPVVLVILVKPDDPPLHRTARQLSAGPGRQSATTKSTHLISS